MVSSALTSVGCGPSVDEPENELRGELLVRESSPGHELATTPVTLSIVGTDGTRQRVPIEWMRPEAVEARWGLEGDLVVARA